MSDLLNNAPIPAHYDKPVTPWDLELHMESSGSAFVDARRTDAIEYAFRKKDNMLEDLKKARHCLDSAIQELARLHPPLVFKDKTSPCMGGNCVDCGAPLVARDFFWDQNRSGYRCMACVLSRAPEAPVARPDGETIP